MGLLSAIFGLSYESNDPSLSGNNRWVDRGCDGYGRRKFLRRGRCEAKDLSGNCNGCVFIGRHDGCPLM